MQITWNENSYIQVKGRSRQVAADKEEIDLKSYKWTNNEL